MSRMGNLQLEELGSRTLLFARPEDRKRLLSDLVLQANASSTPFFWLMGNHSVPVGEMILLSRSDEGAHLGLAESKISDLFNGYTLDHIGGMQALSGDLLENHSTAAITEYIMWMTPTDNELVTSQAISLLCSLILLLQWRRDNQCIHITWDRIRRATHFDSVQAFAEDHQLPANVRQSLQAYLRALPGYKAGAAAGQQDERVLDNHGWLQMTLTRSLLGTARRLSIGREFILKTQPHMAPALDRGLGWCMERWANQNLKGLIILDGLDKGTQLVSWLYHARPALQNLGQRVVVMVDEFEDFNSQDRALLERMQLEEYTVASHAVARVGRL